MSSQKLVVLAAWRPAGAFDTIRIADLVDSILNVLAEPTASKQSEGLAKGLVVEVRILIVLLALAPLPLRVVVLAHQIDHVVNDARHTVED